MEDDNRLELSLGPPSTGKPANAMGKTGTSMDARSGVNDRDTKLINEFKHFLDGGIMQIGPGMPSETKPECFFGNNSNTPIDVETSKNSNVGGFWITKDRSTEGNEENTTDVPDEENTTDVREKRKNMFGEASQQKKHDKETDHSDLHDKSRASHISINTDDDSTADNEDVADSEADASRSRMLLQADNVARQCVGSNLSEVQKNFHEISQSSAVEFQGTKRFTISSGKDFKFENASQSIPFPNQPVNIMSVHQSNSAGMNIRPTYPVPGTVQAVSTTSNERTGSQPVLAANLPVLVGYNPVPLSKLDKDASRVPVSHHQLISQSSFGRGQSNSDKHNDGIPPKSSEFRQHDAKATDHALGSLKQPVEGTRTEDGLKGISTTSSPLNGLDQPRAEGFPSEFPTIKPGIAADLQFGGCGTYPNLPWVSTTGSGPHGRTISGVTYRYSPTQIRIVCACHGTHLSPEEFVQHACEEHTMNQDASAGVSTLPSCNPEALAKG